MSLLLATLLASRPHLADGDAKAGRGHPLSKGTHKVKKGQYPEPVEFTPK